MEGFLKLRPPTYDGTDPDPLVADDWLKEMEKKLDLTLSPTMSVLELPHTSSQAQHTPSGIVLVIPMRTLKHLVG